MTVMLVNSCVYSALVLVFLAFPVLLFSGSILVFALILVTIVALTAIPIMYWRRMCKNFGIVNYRMVGSRKITAFDTVNMCDKKTNGYLPIAFDKVRSNFHIQNMGLTTLKGCPKEVEGDFRCDNNNLTSLYHSPSTVGVRYNVTGNMLSDLHGCPQVIYELFICERNNLTTMDGGPTEVFGSVFCEGNESLSAGEILKWYSRCRVHGTVKTDHQWLNNFLNHENKNHIWKKDFDLLVKKYCND